MQVDKEELSPKEARELLEALEWHPSALEAWRQGFEQNPKLMEAFRANTQVAVDEYTEKLIASEDAEARGAIKALRNVLYTFDVVEKALEEAENGN